MTMMIESCSIQMEGNTGSGRQDVFDSRAGSGSKYGIVQSPSVLNCAKRDTKPRLSQGHPQSGVNNGGGNHVSGHNGSESSSSSVQNEVVPKGIWRYLTPTKLHLILPYIFFVETIAVGVYGLDEVIPYLYGDSALYHQLLSIVMVTEIIMNWFLIAYTDSSFSKSKFPKETLTFDLSPEKVPMIVRDSPGKDDITDRHFSTSMFPYWAWSPCYKCKTWRPPRCYHCALCDACVLKRDHHCFFARNCVGVKNQKYFLIFCTWTFLSQMYALVLGLWYYFSLFWSHVTIFDLLPFASFSRYMFGYSLGHTGILVMMGWVLAALIPMSLAQFCAALDLLTTGRTSFEREYKMDVADTRSGHEKLQAVFGDLWYVQFFIPLFGDRFSPKDDPYHWKYIQPPKRRPVFKINRD